MLAMFGPAIGSACSISRSVEQTHARGPSTETPDAAVSDAIRQNDRLGEFSIALGQGVFAAFILSLHLVSAVRHEFETFCLTVFSILVVLGMSALVRAGMALRTEFVERRFTVLTLIDAALLVGLIWSYSIAYDIPATASLKSPTIVFLFAFVGLRAMRHSAYAVFVAALAVAVAWVGAITLTYLFSTSFVTTKLYEEFLVRHSFLAGAEIERLVALILMACGVAIGAQRGRALVEKITRSQLDLRHMAHHDALTGLPNRLLFQMRLDRAAARLARGEGYAVLALDLDDFKIVNDTYGHPVGDELLKLAAKRVSRAIRDLDTLARLGGDEFSIIMVQVGEAEGPAALAGRIISALSLPFEIEGHKISVNTSIGIAIAPRDGETTEELLVNADLALYRAKEEGRGVYRFFTKEMDRRIQGRKQNISALSAAIDNQTLQVLYEPVFATDEREVRTIEAMPLWPRPDQSSIGGHQLINVAQEVGLYNEVGDYILRRVCEDALALPPSVRVSVNVEPMHFRAGHLLEIIDRALCDTGLAAHRLELEISECGLLQDIEKGTDVLASLSDLGVRLTLDHFGTGYSSLGYLHALPFEKVKIDRTFVSRVGEDADVYAVVRAVVQLGRDLNMTTAASGVETALEFDALAQLGCKEVQGPLFAKPLPLTQIRQRTATNLVQTTPNCASKDQGQACANAANGAMPGRREGRAA